jgi:undecaprenyl-diphosphatase
VPDWLAVILLGVIEGITEFLPVSSTGHLLVAERWLGHRTELFNIVIQTGAVVAALPPFRPRLQKILSFSPEGRLYAAKVLLAFVITGAGGLTLKKLGLELPETVGPVAAALVVGGVAFLVVERLLKGRPLQDEVTWGVAAAVGAAQLAAAVFPGTSRSGSTILIMLALGLSRVAATEFTFLVGIPTIMAASAYSVLKALKAGDVHEDWAMVALGFVVSAIVSFVVVKWLLRYVQNHTFAAFGWYRIALGAVLFLLLAIE